MPSEGVLIEPMNMPKFKVKLVDEENLAIKMRSGLYMPVERLGLY